MASFIYLRFLWSSLSMILVLPQFMTWLWSLKCCAIPDFSLEVSSGIEALLVFLTPGTAGARHSSTGWRYWPNTINWSVSDEEPREEDRKSKKGKLLSECQKEFSFDSILLRNETLHSRNSSFTLFLRMDL